MLIISYGSQQERLCGLSLRSSAFVSCLATLGNGFLGLRPYVPGSSERVSRVQLLVAGLYAPGVGVAREIVSLPAPRVLRIYDVDTGALAIDAEDESPTMTLSLDGASVSSTQQLRIRGCVIELMVRQFIDRPGQPAISTVISLRNIGPPGKLRRVRIDYGVDASACNEYLGASPWLTTRHYELGSCRCRDDGFDVVVVSRERALRYDVQMQVAPAACGHITSWGIQHGGCAGSVTFDLSKADRHLLSTHWRICSESEGEYAQSQKALGSVRRGLHSILSRLKPITEEDGSRFGKSTMSQLMRTVIPSNSASGTPFFICCSRGLRPRSSSSA